MVAAQWPAWWVLIYAAALIFFVATLVLDGYRFDNAGMRVYTYARLRRRRFDWRQVDHFEVRGWLRGAGFWTADHRWVRLRAATWPMREASLSEISRLELARQIVG